MMLNKRELNGTIDLNYLFLSFAPVVIIFAFLFLYLIVFQLNVFSFNDAKNYYSIYKKIDVNNLSGLSDVYREAGLVYLFFPFKALGVDFSQCLKFIYCFFSFLVLLVALGLRQRTSFSLVAALSVVLFVISNRLYIEGAFNFVRSWVALHFLMFGWFAFFFFTRKFSFLPSITLLALAAATHFQTSVIGVLLLTVLWFGNRIVSSRIVAVALTVSFCVALALLVDVLGLRELISSVNDSAAENAKKAGGIKASLAYQTILPICCMFFVLCYSLRRRDGRSLYVVIPMQCAIISVGATWSVPVLLRFFILSLIYMVLVFPKIGVLRNTAEYFFLFFVGVLNCFALFFSDIWIAV